MNKTQKELAGKTVIADKVATQFSLSDREKMMLDAGMVVYDEVVD